MVHILMWRKDWTEAKRYCEEIRDYAQAHAGELRDFKSVKVYADAKLAEIEEHLSSSVQIRNTL